MSFNCAAVWAVQDAVAHERFHEARVGGVDGLVALHLFEELAAAETSGGGDLRDHEGFGAEGFGRALLGVHTEALDGCAHHDDAGHADYDAKQRQKTAQFLGADGVHGQLEGVEKVIPGTVHRCVALGLETWARNLGLPTG